ncbi:MAG: NAD(P)/FAD-dependent oxidoreductase [Ferruginibacter sp.]
MAEEKIYDLAIVGGGLAGLSLSILAAQKGYAVILFEKESYPFHKVCGEYISLESWNFLESLSLHMNDLKLPIIKKLEVSAPDGNLLKQTLDLGGFGISRFLLDNKLKEIADAKGVQIYEDCKVEDIIFRDDNFSIQTKKANFQSKICAGSFGKRSNIDIKWKRPFTASAKGALQNYVGIKYHVKYPQPIDTISLHNFSDGYCGISNIEDGKCCLCYLTTASNLKKAGNDIEKMEKEILSVNPHLEEILKQSEKLYATPISISQISFQQKSLVENHVLMMGDAAGMITPLCGNGMSMAMHGAKIASCYMNDFLQSNITRREMENAYSNAWKKQFAGRLRTGRMIQRFFGNKTLTNIFIGTLKFFPAISRWLIKQTHGRPY